MNKVRIYHGTATKETPAQARMRRAVEYLTNYMVTYPKQPGYKDYSDETLINDVLYGLGVGLSEKYRMADGFREFKAVLLKHLKESQ